MISSRLKSKEKKSVSLEVLEVKKKENIEIMKHQEKVVKYISQSKAKGIIVFHSVGSGKTITSLFAAKKLIEENPGKHVIIATPASLVSNFETTIKKLKLKFQDRIKIESYQKLSNYFKKNGVGICTNAILIIDEAHNFNGGGALFESFFNCAKTAFKVILLSATLVKNSPGEFSKQLSLTEGLRVNNAVIDNMARLDDDKRRKKLFNNFFRCKISFHENADFTNYPKVENHIIKLKMSPQYYKEYYKIQEDVRSDLPEFLEDTNNITVFLNGIRRASNKTNVLSPKISWIAHKIVEDYNKGKKILIYSNWIDTGITILKQILEAEEIKFSAVVGGMSKKEKDLSISKYNSGKTKIMLVSASGSEGLNLKETRTVIIMEPYWNKSRILQVIGRASRYMSHSKLPEKDRIVDVYHLILDKPIRSQRFSDDKLDSADIMLWDMSQVKQDLIDLFYDTLEKISIEKDGSCFT